MSLIKTFHNLDENKQTKILNAAMKEFAEKGYEQASTNNIVKNAHIGKGMLFYYFKTKLDLYYFLVDYSIEFVESNYFSEVDMKQTDFIERMKQASTVKMEAYKAHPDLFHFLGNILIDEHITFPPQLQTKHDTLYKRGFSLLYDNIDKTLFRSDVDVEKAFQLIRWAIDGYQNDLIVRLQGNNLAHIDFDPYWDEFFHYLEVLKTAFYKENRM